MKQPRICFVSIPYNIKVFFFKSRSMFLHFILKYEAFLNYYIFINQVKQVKSLYIIETLFDKSILCI